MESQLGRYVTEEREKRGWSRQKLAGRIGYQNLNKGARRIEQLEKQGTCDAELFSKIVEALELDSRTIQEKIELDQKAFDAFLDEPVPMEMIVRSMAAVYVRHPLPEAVKTREQAIAYACEYAKTRCLKVCLVLSRRHSFWIDESGNGVMQETTLQNSMNTPYMQVSGSGKKFLFDFSFS